LEHNLKTYRRDTTEKMYRRLIEKLSRWVLKENQNLRLTVEPYRKVRKEGHMSVEQHAPWALLHPRMTAEALGDLPFWMRLDDPRGAAEQLDSHYRFGGFKQFPIEGFTSKGDFSLKYPGDPTLTPLAMAVLREETICLYMSDIVAVFQKDGSFVVARFD
jgi:hypothetical protein